MPVTMEDRPSICTSVCDFPDCNNKETTEAYPEAEPVQRIPNDWYVVDINKVEIPSKHSTTSLPGGLMVLCPLHGKKLFRGSP